MSIKEFSKIINYKTDILPIFYNHVKYAEGTFPISLTQVKKRNKIIVTTSKFYKPISTIFNTCETA